MKGKMQRGFKNECPRLFLSLKTCTSYLCWLTWFKNTLCSEETRNNCMFCWNELKLCLQKLFSEKLPKIRRALSNLPFSVNIRSDFQSGNSFFQEQVTLHVYNPLFVLLGVVNFASSMFTGNPRHLRETKLHTKARRTEFASLNESIQVVSDLNSRFVLFAAESRVSCCRWSRQLLICEALLFKAPLNDLTSFFRLVWQQCALNACEHNYLFFSIFTFRRF